MDAQTEAKCQEALNKFLDFVWFKVRTRMLLLGESYEQAKDAIIEEMKTDVSDSSTPKDR